MPKTGVFVRSEEDDYLAQKQQSERKHAAVRVSSDLPKLPIARGLPQAERKDRGRQAAAELHGSPGRDQRRRWWRWR